MTLSGAVLEQTKADDVFPFLRIIPKNRITILWGGYGSGKSTLTNVYELEAIKAGHKVLHIEQDESREDIKKRLASVNDWVGCPAHMVRENMKLRDDLMLKLDTDEGAEKLMELVELHKPRVLVLSPIGTLVEGDINLQPVAIKFFDAIKAVKRVHNCTVVLHGHLNKKGLPTGSVHWNTMTDMAWLLEKLPDMIQDAPHRMIVSRVKNRVEAPMGFEWTLTPPRHHAKFVKIRTDSLAVDDRAKMSSVLGFVYDQFMENVRAAKQQESEDDYDEEGKRVRRKKANPWVTIPEYMGVHEATMGSKFDAYSMFGKAREMGLVGMLSNGAKGVQRFYPTNKAVAWLSENKMGLDRAPHPSTLLASKVISTTVVAVAPDKPMKTEEEMGDDVWSERDDEEQDAWNQAFADSFEQE